VNHGTSLQRIKNARKLSPTRELPLKLVKLQEQVMMNYQRNSSEPGCLNQEKQVASSSSVITTLPEPSVQSSPTSSWNTKDFFFQRLVPPCIEREWLNVINAYFDACKTTDKDRDDNQDNQDEVENGKEKHNPST
jgi:hypothetical protein